MSVKLSREIVADLFVAVHSKQAEKYGGETTLNELRVISLCYQAFTYQRTESITSLSKTLGIPMSTAHRCVTRLIANGWLIDEPHPSDGRKRVIRLSDKAVQGGLWDKVEAFIRTYPKRAEGGPSLSIDV